MTATFELESYSFALQIPLVLNVLNELNSPEKQRS